MRWKLKYSISTGVVAVCLCWCVSVVDGGAEPGQLYSSLAHMEALFTFDQLVGQVVKDLPEHHPAATKYLQGYRIISLDRDNGVDVNNNPLHVYSVIKRLVLFWPHIQPALDTYVHMDGENCKDQDDNCVTWAFINECIINRAWMITYCTRSCQACPTKELLSQIQEVRERSTTTVLPTANDLSGAALALARLQRIYRIPIGAFMAGNLAGTTSAVRLESDDCLRVANVTHQQGIYNYALLWYRYCHHMSKEQSHIHHNIKEELTQATEEHNSKWKNSDANFFSRQVTVDGDLDVPWDSDFGKACRGEHTPVPESWRLKCHIGHRGSPWLRLRPVRYEQLHYDPELYIFHDVIADSEIEAIKRVSIDLLARSMVSDPDPTSTKSHESQVRVSHTAWLSNKTDPVLINVAKRISHVTGLLVYEGEANNMAGENLQVLNYGIGGHYDAHLDPLFKWATDEQFGDCYPEVKKEECHKQTFLPGDRLATWMFFLSNVEAGGRTAFPLVGLSVAPIKGSAVFWYNLKNDGLINRQSNHGGCPVLLGQKWATNKWIREHENFRRHPCLIDR